MTVMTIVPFLILLIKAIVLSIFHFLILKEKNLNKIECKITLQDFLIKYILFYLVIQSLASNLGLKQESIDMLFVTRMTFDFTDSCLNEESLFMYFTRK